MFMRVFPKIKPKICQKGQCLACQHGRMVLHRGREPVWLDLVKSTYEAYRGRWFNFTYLAYSQIKSGGGRKVPYITRKTRKRLALACKIYSAGSVTHFWPEVWLNFAASLFGATNFHCSFSQYVRISRQGSICTDPDDANILSPVPRTIPSIRIVVGRNCQDIRVVVRHKLPTRWGRSRRWRRSLFARLWFIPIDRGLGGDPVVSMERFRRVCNCGGSAEGW